jgi:hypothetical protein
MDAGSRGAGAVLNYELSISNGHTIIVDTVQLKPTIEPFLEQLKALPFVTDLDFSPEGRHNDREADGILKIHAPKETYRFLVEQKRSYLDRGALNALIAQAKLYATERREPLVLFARYIPGPSAERLIQSGINFVDQTGNMHLVFGRNYERTVVGTKQNAAGTEECQAERGRLLRLPQRARVLRLRNAWHRVAFLLLGMKSAS